jgi:quinol monooxygenase YgiN
MSNHVYWTLKADINPGKLDQVQALMHEMVTATNEGEPETLNYEWSFNEDNSILHIHERYADSAATMVHLANFGSKFAERILAVLVPTSLEVYGNPSNEVKEALGAFGAQYFTSAEGFVR